MNPMVTALALCTVAAPFAAAGSPSLEELDAACEAARQEKLAPLRAAEIERCKAEPRNDPDWCERFYRDYGEGGRNARGAVVGRMFDDLPECIAAEEARRTTSRRPGGG